MATKLKMTGFARFILVLALLTPLAYIGASYYNGEDGIQNIKNLIQGGKNHSSVTIQADQIEPAQDVTTLQDQVKELNERVQDLTQENAELKAQIQDLQKGNEVQ